MRIYICKLKKAVQIFLTCVIMCSLTGCLNRNIRNLSDKEIVRQIQEKMKEEMDKLHFEVDFSDYEFQVNTGVEIQSNFGTVTIRDKRFKYKSIKIYDGNFEVIDKNKIGVNPIVFVYGGYLNYLDKSSEEIRRIIDEYLIARSIKYELMEFSEKDFTGIVTYPFSLEIKNGKPEKNIINNSEFFLWNKEKLTLENYLNYYKNKNAKKIDYQQYDMFMSRGVLYFYSISNYENIIDIEREAETLIKSDRIFIQFGK